MYGLKSTAHLLHELAVYACERCYEVLLAVVLANQLSEGLCQLNNLGLAGILFGSNQILFVALELFHVLGLLLLVQHLPTGRAKHLAVRLKSYLVQLVKERVPVGRFSLDH